MMKFLLAMNIALISFAGAARAADFCEVSGQDPLGQYDYYNRVASPKILKSAITCEEAIVYIYYGANNFGSGGVVSPHTQLWSWTGQNCHNVSGEGLPLANAVAQLILAGCPSGTLCAVGIGHDCTPF